MALWTIWLDGSIIHQPVTSARAVTDAVLTLGLDSAGTLEVSVPTSHPDYALVAGAPVLGRPTWRVERDGVEVFRGRTLLRERMPLDGAVHVVAEGDLAMLNDSLCAPYEFSGSPSAYLAKLVEGHNAQVEPWKRFSAGRVTVVDKGGNDYIVRGSQSSETTWDELSAKTVKSSDGGHLVLRRGTHVIDWLADASAPCDQPVKVGLNLLELSDECDGAELATAIHAVGADGDDGRLEIASSRTGGAGVTVRGGILLNDALVAEHGTVVREVAWDDVTTEAALWSKALAYCQSLALPRSVTVKAIDMSDAGHDVDAFDVGQWVALDALDTQGRMQVTGIEWDLLDPIGGSITFGRASVTSSGSNAITTKTADSAMYVAGSASGGGSGTTYALTKSGTTITLEGSDGSETSVSDGSPGEATATVSLSNIGSGTKTLTLTRVGDVVHATMTATATAATANSPITCGTVPSGYRPTHNEYQSGVCVSNNNLSGDYRWCVATDGTVTYWCSVTTIRESPLCMTWVTNDSFPS